LSHSRYAKRIALVGLFKAWGGIERSISVLVPEFENQGVASDIVVLRSGEAPYRDLLPSSTTVRYLHNRTKLDGARHFAAYLRRERPDAVVTTQDHSAKVAVLGRALAGMRVPLYLKVTNTASQTIRRAGQRWATRRLYPWANGMIAVSGGVRDDLIKAFGLPGDRIHVIYNPVVTRDFPRRLEVVPEHPWLVSGTRIPVILAAGRLTRQKGFDVLLQAFARLRRQRPARLLILGEGKERDVLEGLVRDNAMAGDVELPGFVEDPVPYMAHADLFVLSSRWEGLGNVLVEALAARCPLVATDCPSGPQEILEQGRHGTLVPPDDVAALAEAMGRALDAPHHPAAEAADRFRGDRVARRYLETVGLG